jgi:hypothetical protein
LNVENFSGSLLGLWHFFSRNLVKLSQHEDEKKLVEIGWATFIEKKNQPNFCITAFACVDDIPKQNSCKNVGTY